MKYSMSGNDNCGYGEMPRVLVVAANSLNDQSNTGLTMLNLFRHWSPYSIAQIHMDASTPDLEVCPHSYGLTRRDAVLGSLMNKVSRDITGVGPGTPVLSEMKGAGSSTRWRARLRIGVRAWADLLPIRPPSDCMEWLERFKPQVIYTVLGSIRVMDLVLLLSRRFRIPIVPHFMDDWPSTLYSEGVLSAVPRLFIMKRIGEILRRSWKGLAISRAMAVEYARNSGAPFEAFMNCVPMSAEPKAPIAQPRGADRPISLLYVGGLHLNRWELLSDIGAACGRLGDQGLRAECVVYAPAAHLENYGAVLSANAALRIGGTLRADEVIPRLSEADILVHVESFDKNIQRYTRLSLSTKIPQYMSAELPILAYGPAQLASCRYVEESGGGLVVGRRDTAELIEAIRTLISSPDLRRTMGAAGWRTALARHDADIERSRFADVIRDAADLGVPFDPGRASPID